MTFPSCLADHFQKTARTKIDVHEGTLTMEFDGEVIKFNIFDAMRFPTDVNYVYALDVIAELSQNIHDLSNEDEFLTVLTKSLDNAELQKVRYQINAELLEEIQQEDPGAS